MFGRGFPNRSRPYPLHAVIFFEATSSFLSRCQPAVYNAAETVRVRGESKGW